MTRFSLRIVSWIIAFVLLASCTAEREEPAVAERASASESTDTRAITQLLDLLDTLVAHSPDSQVVLSMTDDADPRERRRILDSLAQLHAADSQINRQIDSLLSLPAYGLYYAQFNNVTPETHRAVFYALPYEAINSPADIAGQLLELCLHRDAVRAWVDSVLTQVDLQRAHNIAVEWVPEGEYSVPMVRFIYDGNGDAFARAGEVCFDLYSIVISRRRPDIRFENLGSAGVKEIEAVLAHEMQHVYARPYLYPPGRSFGTWQEQWKDHIIRRFVAEGVAMQCNPPYGFRKEVKEDSGVVRFWIDALNEKFTALDEGTITESEFQQWYRMTYQTISRNLLQDYGKRQYPHILPREFLIENQVDRPTFDYTLGWWMISHILRTENGKAKVIGLLSDPSQLFDLYNQSLSEDEAAFLVTLRR